MIEHVSDTDLYFPLALSGGSWLIRQRLVGPAVVSQAIAAGILYHLWSAWNHRRHATTGDLS